MGAGLFSGVAGIRNVRRVRYLFASFLSTAPLADSTIQGSVVVCVCACNCVCFISYVCRCERISERELDNAQTESSIRAKSNEM